MPPPAITITTRCRSTDRARTAAREHRVAASGSAAPTSPGRLARLADGGLGRLAGSLRRWLGLGRSEPRRLGERIIQVWDDRVSGFRRVDLDDPDDPLWLTAYHVHALGKGQQTGPAF